MFLLMPLKKRGSGVPEAGFKRSLVIPDFGKPHNIYTRLAAAVTRHFEKMAEQLDGRLPRMLASMRQKWLLRLLALVSFLVLVITFLWCILENIATSAELAKAGVVMPVTSITVLTGLFWLIGHGVHGVAAMALPIFIFHRRTKNELNNVY